MKLEEHGYPLFAEWYMEWRKTKSRDSNRLRYDNMWKILRAANISFVTTRDSWKE